MLDAGNDARGALASAAMIFSVCICRDAHGGARLFKTTGAAA